MSKHKHFHGKLNGVKTLQHGRREGIGPFSKAHLRRVVWPEGPVRAVLIDETGRVLSPADEQDSHNI